MLLSQRSRSLTSPAGHFGFDFAPVRPDEASSCLQQSTLPHAASVPALYSLSRWRSLIWTTFLRLPLRSARRERFALGWGNMSSGQSRTVKVAVPTSALGVVQGDIDASGAPTLEHGTYVFSTGTAADTVTPAKNNSIDL